MTPDMLAALECYATGWRSRCPLTATALADARRALSAAGLVRNTSKANPLFVELTDAGHLAWVGRGPMPAPVALEPEPAAPTQMSLFDLAGAS